MALYIYWDDAGRAADFHSLRHSFITILVKMGVNPKVVQALARHSSIKLTMDRYSHLSSFNERPALQALPKILPEGKKSKETSRAVAKKTGTYDLPVATVKKTVEKTVTKTATYSLLYETANVRNSR